MRRKFRKCDDCKRAKKLSSIVENLNSLGVLIEMNHEMDVCQIEWNMKYKLAVGHAHPTIWASIRAIPVDNEVLTKNAQKILDDRQLKRGNELTRRTFNASYTTSVSLTVTFP